MDTHLACKPRRIFLIYMICLAIVCVIFKKYLSIYAGIFLFIVFFIWQAAVWTGRIVHKFLERRMNIISKLLNVKEGNEEMIIEEENNEESVLLNCYQPECEEVIDLEE